MSSRSGRDVARGLVALVALLALVVGVPVGLAVLVGWPLPTGVPTTNEVRDAVTRVGISDWTVVKLVACVLWLAWAQLAISVVIELFALVRRRSVGSLPTLGTARGMAASLLTSVMLIVSSGRIASAAPAAPTARPVAAAAARVSVVAEVVPVPPDTTAVVPAVRTWTVRPRDTLWGIAEQMLGRGERWVEIRRLNVGRHMAPGVTFTERTEWLRPGWVLAVPGDVSALPSTPPAAAAVMLASDPATTVTVGRGDSLSLLATRAYGDGTKWHVIWEANKGRHFGARTFDNPSLILPGWELVVPALDSAPAAEPTPPEDPSPSPAVPVPESPPAPAPLPPEGAPAPTAPPPSTASPSPTTTLPPPPSTASPSPTTTLPPTPPAPADHAEPAATVARPAWVLPAGISGATLLATGLAGLVAGRRRRRLRGMGPNDALPMPNPDLGPTDAAARLGNDPAATARLDVALRGLSRLVSRDADGSLPRAEAVLRRASGELEAFFGGTVVAPAPWLATADSHRIVLPAGVTTDELADIARGGTAPCPALVMLGVTADAELYIDLEAAGVVALDGSPEVAHAVARAMVATLAVSPIADLVHVVTTGVSGDGLANEERVQSVSDPDAALELTASLSAGVRRALAGAPAAGTHDLRRADPHEPWEPVVAIILGASLSTAQITDIRRLVESGGVAVVTDAKVPGVRYVVRAGAGGALHVDPVGVEVIARGLAADELDAVAALLSDAEAPPVALEPAPIAADLAGVAFEDPPWSLLVRLLGPVDVVDADGRAAEFERAKALELVVWLAQHRGHPTRMGARTAMWETDVRDATFANVVSDARGAMARLVAPPDGEEWLARTYGEHLPLHPLVRTDADLVAARLDHARRQPDEDAVITLRAALELVRDVPYAGTLWLWPDGQALPSHLTLLVTSAATEMARRCLALGDHDGVFWATGQGMKVLPGHDELVCLRMHAHAAAGNLAGVRKEFEGYERVVTADPWGDGEPAAKVVATRNRLLAPNGRRQP